MGKVQVVLVQTCMSTEGRNGGGGGRGDTYRILQKGREACGKNQKGRSREARLCSWRSSTASSPSSPTGKRKNTVCRFPSGSTPKNGTLKIPYWNHICGHLDEQSKPMLRGARECQPSAGRIPPEGVCCRKVMTGGETETVNANACRREVRVKRCAPSGRSNRRPFSGQPVMGKNPGGYLPGSRYDKGMPTNASCLEPEKSGYNGRRRLSSRMAVKNDRSVYC